MIWVKTEAGRAEMQSRALIAERPLRNLLLVVDGVKSQDYLVEHLTGISAADFGRLEALGLIAPASAPALASALAPGRPREPVDAPAPPDAPVPSAALASAPPDPAPRPGAADAADYGGFTATLTQLIAKELGLRGFRLTLALEKAATAEDLRAVAERAVIQIGERRGEAAAASARQALFGA